MCNSDTLLPSLNIFRGDIPKITPQFDRTEGFFTSAGGSGIVEIVKFYSMTIAKVQHSVSSTWDTKRIHKASHF